MSECLLVPPRLSAVQNTDASSPARRPGTVVHDPPHPASGGEQVSNAFQGFLQSLLAASPIFWMRLNPEECAGDENFTWM